MKSAEFKEVWLEHIKRFDNRKWPIEGSPEFRETANSVWEKVKEAEADDFRVASLAMMTMQIYTDDHLYMLVNLTNTYHRGRLNAARDEIPVHEYVKRESRKCVDCGGSGIAERFSHQTGKSVLFFCVECKLGVWMAQNQRGEKKLRDMADPGYEKLRMRAVGDGTYDNPYRYPREQWDAENDRPIQVDLSRWFPSASKNVGASGVTVA